MFSLIIVIISIALVAALAVATIYYGGAAFTGWQTEAAAAQLLNESSQLEAAVNVYTVDQQTTPDTLQQLVDFEYLQDIPSGDWQVEGNSVVRVDLTENQCLAANKRLGVNLVPSCADPEYVNATVCCSL